MLPKDNLDLVKNILYFTTAGDWDCEAVIKYLSVIRFCVDFIVLPFGIMRSIAEL